MLLMHLHRARVDIISPLVAHFQPVYTSHTNAYATLNYAFTFAVTRQRDRHCDKCLAAGCGLSWSF